MKMPSKEAMKTRFHEIKKTVEDIETKTAPLRAERDSLVNSVNPKIAKLEKQYKDLEAPLFELKNEFAMIARALGGQTGEAP